MGTSSFSFDSPGVPLARQATTIAVATWDGTGGKGAYTILPNVVCEDVQIREGADPGSARFRYTLNDSDPSLPWPDGFEDLYPIDATGAYVVENDTRLVVMAIEPDGSDKGDSPDITVLFDGFAQIPEVALSSGSQAVTFQALGVSVRLWDKPIKGALYQDADDPDGPNKPVKTHLPVRFNPSDGDHAIQPNRVPDGYRIIGNGDNDYPIFLDPGIARDPDPRKNWTLADAVQYLIWQGNPDEKYVQNGETNDLSEFLVAFKPKQGSDTYDPRDAGTYDTEDIIIRDFDASNKPWIESVDELVNAYGFRVNFKLSPDDNGDPKTTLQFTRRDGGLGGTMASLYLQSQGDALDPGRSNVGSMQITRDLAEVYNQVRLETDPLQYEVSVILAPGFAPDADDAGDTLKGLYTRASWNDDTPQDIRDKYRLFIFDECGDGHWDFKTAGTLTTPGNLTNALSLDGDGNPPGDGKRTYVNRYRPGQYELLSKGDKNKPFRAGLAISYDYTGASPALWDGQAGHWQPISGGWELTKDRLGIRVNVEDPSKWDVGDYGKTDATHQVNGKAVNVIVSMAEPTATGTANARFFLRLTTVIDGDKGMDIVSKKRSSSPTEFVVERKLDCRDHFRLEWVNNSSPYFDVSEAIANDTGNQVAARDDTKLAQAYADGMRAAHELPPTAGSVTIPRLTASYPIGTQITGLVGRTTNFKSNGGDSGEGDQFPQVVAIRYVFGDKQETVLMLSDRRAEPLRS